MTNPFKEPLFKASLKSIGLALVAVTPIVYGFYYDTNKTLDTNSKKIDKIESDLDAIKESVIDDEIFKGTSRIENKALREKVEDIDEKLDVMIKIMGDYMIEDKQRNHE